jgi:hypothetical protein
MHYCHHYCHWWWCKGVVWCRHWREDLHTPTPDIPSSYNHNNNQQRMKKTMRGETMTETGKCVCSKSNISMSQSNMSMSQSNIRMSQSNISMTKSNMSMVVVSETNMTYYYPGMR